MTVFSRQRVIDNINSLLQFQHRKVGDLEKALGVSTGYISRLSKEGNDSTLGAEFVFKAACFFEVSADALIEVEFGKTDPMIRYIQRFIDKLAKGTETDEQKWTAIPTHRISDMLIGKAKIEFPVCCYKDTTFGQDEDEELTSENYFEYEFGAYGHLKLVSAFYPSVVVPRGDVFHTKLGEEKELYLVQYYPEGSGDKELFYELMVVDINKEKQFNSPSNGASPVLNERDIPPYVFPVCNTMCPDWEPIQNEISNLYRTVSRSQMRIRLNPTVKSAIDEFMGGAQ